MSENDIILLNTILDEQKTDTISQSDFFEIFAFEQLLKNFDLSNDEIKSGKTGGGDDGGIDGFFIFLNDNLILEKEINKDEIKKNPAIDLFIIQATESKSFNEEVFNKLSDTISSIFDLTKDMEKLKNFYNVSVIEKSSIFRDIYTGLASKYPKINVYFFYAAKADTNSIHLKVKNKAKKLKDKTKKLLGGSNVEVKFVGARELLEFFRTEKTYTLQLEFTENFSKGENDYAVLCDLVNYYKFVTDDSKNLRKYIFESNVRDYQGEVEVNKDIKKTLESGRKTDFWWLNNGITLIAKKASVTGKTITLDDVQIVNGLQTTRCIYDYLHTKRDLSKEKNKNSLLVKVIITEDVAVRDNIIKATNFQTRIPDASLRATDVMQRDLEDFFKNHGWYYDRRKNYYKNLGKSADKIISIPYLAQSITAILLKEPDIARGRPASIIKKDDDYKKVFNPSMDLRVYLNIAKAMKKVENYLRDRDAKFTVPEKTNFRFHIAMITIMHVYKKKDYQVKDLIDLDIKKVNKKLTNDTIKFVLSSASKFLTTQGGTLDSIAKSRSFLDNLLSIVKLK